MAWLRIDADYPVDGAVASTGFVWAWTLILAAMKRAKVFGVVTDSDICDRALFNVGQVQGCPAGRTFTVRDAYLEAGLIVQVEGGWTATGWARYQEDPKKSDRQATWREANKERRAEAERNRRLAKKKATQDDAAETRGDVATLENATRDDGGDAWRRVMTPDRDLDIDKQQHLARTHAREAVASDPPADAAPAADALDPVGEPNQDFRTVEVAWLSGLAKKQLMLSGAQTAVIRELLREYSAEVITTGIRESVETTNDVNAKYLRKVCATLAARASPVRAEPDPPQQPRRPVQRPTAEELDLIFKGRPNEQSA